MNIPASCETEKAKDQWIRHRLLMTDNEKYVKRGQALIIRDDPQRYEGVMVTNRNKVGAPFQYAESLFAALAAVKSATGLPYRHLQGMLIETLGDWDTPATRPYTGGSKHWRSKRMAACLPSRAVGQCRSPRSRLHRPKAAQQGRVDQAQVEGPERIRQLHVVVDVDTKKILAVQVTDDRTGDSPMFIPLLDEALEVATRTGQAQDSAAWPADAGCCLYGDAAYASRSNVTACGDRGVDSRIKLRVNSMARGKGTRRRMGDRSQGAAWRIC